jgi:hypothetical protein
MDLIDFKVLLYNCHTLLKHIKRVTPQVRIQGITICIPQNLIYKYVESHTSKITHLHKIINLLTYKNTANPIDKIMKVNRIS